MKQGKAINDAKDGKAAGLKGINSLNDLKDRNDIRDIKVNKGNFTATLIRFNQNLNYEKIYVFRMQI